VSYLLEDDKPPVGRRRTIALLIIILAIGSFAVWHWKHTGSIYPWVAGPSGSLSPEASGAKPVSEAAPQSAQNQGAPSDTKSNAAVDTQTKPPVADAKPATAAPVPASPDQGAPPPASTPGAVTVQNDDSANGRTGQLAGAGSSATASSAANTQPSPNAVPAESPSDRTAAASAKKSAASEGGSATNKVSKASQPAPDTAAENNEDKGEPLFIQGQRYLYGTGVRQNCDLAQKSLLMAAENSNIQAQSTLATMYATGHCVPRSLPLAYRWFAKASHLEPSNSRIEQDLEILWQQMTPEEKQIAIKNR
jgi:TPR repeat protein